MRSRLFVLALALMFAGGLDSFAFAQRGHGGPPRERGPDLLQLTDEQRSSIQDMKLQFERKVSSLRTELHKHRSDLRLEITAEKFNENKVKSILGSISQLRSEIGLMRARHHRSIREILTPEQRNQFDLRLFRDGGRSGRGKGPRRGPMPEK